MSDVQPMLYIEELERGMAFYREQLGFEVSVFGHHKQTDEPLIAGAKLEDAFVMLTNEELFQDGGHTGGGNVRLYFHLEESVDELHGRIVGQPDVEIVQPPTEPALGRPHGDRARSVGRAVGLQQPCSRLNIPSGTLLGSTLPGVK